MSEDSEELTRIYAEDQSDRTPPEGRPIDWDTVAPRDTSRLARIKELCRGDALRTGADYYHAAMILQHAPDADDYLLAHELCVVAVSLGEGRAKWLAAATEDRFLMNLGRPQRFGTQYRADNTGANWFLYPVDPGVSDAQRRAFNVPSLADAQAQAEKMNEKGKP